MKNGNGNGNVSVRIGKTRPVWDTKVFESPNCARDSKGKKIGETQPLKYLIIPQPETKINLTRARDICFIESYTPTPESLDQNITHNKNLEEKTELEESLDEILKFSNPDFRLKTRKSYAKSVIIAKRKAEVFIRGRAIRRTIKRIETTPPDFETFNVSEGFAYRFYFYNIETHKTVIRDIKANTRARTHPTRKIFYPTPSGFKAVKVFLPLNKIIQLKPIKTVIYELELKQGYKINTVETPQPIRTHAKTEISIDYRQLAKAEKRISKKWFKLLTDSLKDENLVSDLTPHLKKLRRKIITSKAVTPNTLRAQKPITPRRYTVTEYNHDLRADAVANTQEMRARKLKVTA